MVPPGYQVVAHLVGEHVGLREIVRGAEPLPLHWEYWLPAGAALVQTALGEQPFSGDVFVFRGKRGDLVKLLWWSGDGMNLYAKRLERGRFVWPQATSGVVHLSAAQLSMLLEGIDWRRPVRTWSPELAA
mgnify:CR=1 FL=1